MTNSGDINNNASNQGGQGNFNAPVSITNNNNAAPQPDPTPLPPLDPRDAWATFNALPVEGAPPAPAMALPAGSRVTLTHNPLFAGRADELRELAVALRRGGTSVISTGIGGVGKTSLAVECAWRYAPWFPGGVFWLSSADEQGLRNDIAACGGASALRLQGGFAARPLDEQVALVLAEWAHDLPRLLVFDNCEQPDLLRRYRPAGGGCRVLATSRNPDWERSLNVTPLALAVLPPDAARELLQSLCPRLSDDAASAVASELGCLPLALHLAGSYLAYYDDIAVADYLAELTSDALDHESLSELIVEDRPTGREMHVARAFLLSFERLQPDDAVDARALALLARAAHLAPGEPLPKTLLEASLPVEGDDKSAARRRTDGIRRLLRLGLLERAGDDALRLHRLLARFALRAIRDDNALAAVEDAVYRTANTINKGGLLEPMQPVLAHLRHLADGALQREDKRAPKLLNEYGYHLKARGDYGAARPYYEQALAICRQALGDSHPDTALSLNNLGMLLQAQGDYAAARPLHEQALAIRRQALGDSHPDTALSLNNLGGLLDSQGDYAAARPLYEQALAIRRQALGDSHPDTAQSLNNLGFLLQAQGDYGAARPYYEQALATYRQALGDSHPDTARSLNNLGLLLRAQGDYGAARPLYEQALAIYRQVLGDSHPDTASSLNNLGALLDSQGDYAAARPYFEQALVIRERMLGLNHPDTAQSLWWIGTILAREGDRPAAREYIQRAVVIYTRTLGAAHSTTQQCQGWLRSLDDSSPAS